MTKQVMERMASQFESKAKRHPGLSTSRTAFRFRQTARARVRYSSLSRCLLAAFLLRQAALACYFKRVIFVAIIGVIAAITTNMSYWNWYGFPKLYTMSYMFTQWVGYLCAGLLIALVIKNVAVRTA